VVRFITLATLGALNIARHPGVLMAALPTYALKFVALNPGTAFIVLGSVFSGTHRRRSAVCGHGRFGKKPIRLACVFLVWPSLAMNYFEAL
jgi:KUP system potassium uptake protein